jgi:hypothetical protein
MEEDVYDGIPTRADHEREEREQFCMLSARFGWLKHLDRDRYVTQRVAELARERHEARVQSARKLCRAAIDRLWPRDVASTIPEAAIAILALHGQGGPGDLGGPKGKTLLPFLDAPFNFRAPSGPAWCAALASVAKGWLLVVDFTEGSIYLEREAKDGEANERHILWRPDMGMELHSEVRAALRRVILGPGPVWPKASMLSAWSGWPTYARDFDRLRTALAMLVC